MRALWLAIIICLAGCVTVTGPGGRGGVACGKLPAPASLPAPTIRSDAGAGLVFEEYDRNGDRLIDYAVVSVMVQADGSQDEYTIAPFPLFYIIDYNYDGYADVSLIDTVGKGRCDDIVLYQDFTVPHEEPKDSRPRATVRGEA